MSILNGVSTNATSVNIKVGNGNLIADVKGDKVNIEAGVGNQQINVEGIDVDVKLDVPELAGLAFNDYDFENDKDTVIAMGHNDIGTINIDTGNGIDTAVAIGHDIGVTMGEGNKHTVIVQGNNVDVTLGDIQSITDKSGQIVDKGRNYVATLENAMDAGLISGSKFEEALKKHITTETVTELVSSSTRTDTLSRVRDVVTSKISETTSLADSNKALWNSLDPAERAYYESIGITADSLSETTADGRAKYIMTVSGKNKLHLYAATSSATTYIDLYGFKNTNQTDKGVYTYSGRDYSKVESGSGYLYLKNKVTTDTQLSGVTATTTETTTTKTQDVTTNIYQTLLNTVYRGANNMNINIGSGDTVLQTSVGNIAGDIKSQIGDTVIQNINGGTLMNSQVIGNFTDIIRGKIQTQIDTITNSTTTGGDFKSSSYYSSTGSPLVVDFDGDGKVEASAGKGVDVDNSGKADGAATGGDKMLAMSNFAGTDGVIDGSEVFGDKTVSPFTKQPLNAKNGFEALRMIAEEAEARGYECINENGDVDLRALKTALNSVGVDLGFISDDNITTLEDLAHIASINVAEYVEQDDEGEVQHNQLGSATTVDGKKIKTDDVWFLES